VQTLFVGEGPLRSALEAQVGREGLEGWIHFLGRRNDVPDILHAGDVFVFPSRWEGFPVAVMEAMAAGLPVVASDVGGISELVQEGKTGMLVPPKDPIALFESLRKLLNDRDFRQRMGIEGKNRIRRDFQLEKMVVNTEQVYMEVLR